MSIADEFEAVREEYRRQGVGLGTTGWGERAAVVVVDFQHAFTRGARSCGLEAVEATAELLKAARAGGVPIIHTFVAFDAGAHRPWGVFGEKCPALQTMLLGSADVEIDPLVAPLDREVVLRKERASAFYGTGLQEALNELGVDTVIVCGTSTSGCVRATVVDSVSRDFRTIVPRECVADRSAPSGAAALFDMDTKYADVLGLDGVLTNLRNRDHGAELTA